MEHGAQVISGVRATFRLVCDTTYYYSGYLTKSTSHTSAPRPVPLSAFVDHGTFRLETKIELRVGTRVQYFVMEQNAPSTAELVVVVRFKPSLRPCGLHRAPDQSCVACSDFRQLSCMPDAYLTGTPGYRCSCCASRTQNVHETIRKP